MKKTIIGIIIVTIALVVVLLLMKKNPKEIVVNEKIQFEYTSNMSVLPFQNSFFIYDGKKLIRKNDKAEDIFSARLVIENYSMKAGKESVYILDKTQKILYNVSKDGEIVNQVKLIEDAQEIYVLGNSDVVIAYSTAVNTDGIIIYDKDLKKKKDINYPNALISTIFYEEGINNMFVSTQIINEVDIINAVYVYDTKYDAISVYQNKNIINMDMSKIGSNKLILDPDELRIVDSEFKNIAKVSAQSSFEKMLVYKDKIYLKDGAKTVRIFDSNGNLVEEKSFKETITNMLSNSSQVVYVGKGNIYYNEKEILIQEDIDKSILLSNNKLILFFTGGIRVVDIPY